MFISPERKREVLLHELGHSFFAYLCGFSVLGIEIFDNPLTDSSAGIAYFKNYIKDVNGEIFVLLAGMFNAIIDEPGKWKEEEFIDPFEYQKNDGSDVIKLVELIIKNTDYSDDDFYLDNEGNLVEDFQEKLYKILRHYIRAILQITEQKSYIELMLQLLSKYKDRNSIARDELDEDFLNFPIFEYIEILKKYNLFNTTCRLSMRNGKPVKAYPLFSYAKSQTLVSE